MKKKNKNRNNKNKKLKKIDSKETLSRFNLPEETEKWISGLGMFLLAIIIILSFFKKAGVAGKAIISLLFSLLGDTAYFLPLILILGGLVFFYTKYRNFLWPNFLAIFLLSLGISAMLESISPVLHRGGYLGYISQPFLKLFGLWVTQILFFGVAFIGALIFWHLLRFNRFLTSQETLEEEKPLISRLVKKVFRGVPKFKIKEVPPVIGRETFQPSKELTSQVGTKKEEIAVKEVFKYQAPPLELLDSKKGEPSAGDIRQNSAIIKKSLENFEIPVEMSEINIGPTVTQYTLKPADGIKLSKITSLSNDLALALASHPIRIEAPIPGKSLVGIEIPNRIRAKVNLRELIENPQFQKSSSNLTFCLGKDVSGNTVYADLARMPHLLVAGATGTGKTIFLNNLIISLLYRNSPKILRLILIDPKRVEFQVYNELPHLLSSVICDAEKTVNALRWLVGEMENRFKILSENRTRDISSYNERAFSDNSEPLPYIVLIIDELADLMAAKGKEVESGVIRLAQMARAVGIHLVVATQRPSVEVITGLIKANITSRVTFQVASQVDSRTVLDVGGAEKLLGAGDLLFISAEVVKPKRIQGAYVSEKEVKRVVNWIKSKIGLLEEPGKIKLDEEINLENRLSMDLERSLETPLDIGFDDYFSKDPLYEEAKRMVIEANKASSSFLQRKLRIGYARAARLIDILEKKGVVGPGEGAKPRKVLIKLASQGDNEDWQKV